MSTDIPTPNPPGPREFTVERPGHSFTTYIPSAAVAEIRAEVAEEIARDLDELTDRAEGPTAAAWTYAAQLAREHAGKGFPSSDAGSAVPAEGSGHPQPATEPLGGSDV